MDINVQGKTTKVDLSSDDIVNINIDTENYELTFSMNNQDLLLKMPSGAYFTLLNALIAEVDNLQPEPE